MDREKLMEKDITLLDIKSKFCNHWEKRYNDIKGLKKEERVLLERITQTSILSNSDNDKYPIIHIRFDMTEFDFSVMVSFIETFIDNFKLKGIENIAKIAGVSEEPTIIFDDETGEMKTIKNWVTYTSGVNLYDIRYVNGIDLNRTVCNDIMIIYETYGIDAARAALIKEFKTVFAAAANNVNYAHLELLCDLMTNGGIPISVDRHGMNKSETDPLARASFEKTVDQLLMAAVFGEVDYMNNVSSRIMAGLVIRGGTGLCNVILDSELLVKSEYLEDIEQKYIKTYTEVSQNAVFNDMITKDISGIFVPE
jgi:DNA-directed RNA polymerase II subunit RPB1